jgi:hypothetical protein
VCHPTFRLNWFGKRSSDEYKQAKALFEHVYDAYAQPAPTGPSGVSPKKRKKSSGQESLLESLLDDMPSDDEFDTFNDFGTESSNQPLSELERYLSGEGGQGELKRPLEWWKVSIIKFKSVVHTNYLILRW